MAYDVSACFETSLLDPFGAFFLVCAKLHWLKELWVKESVNLPGFHHGTAPEYLLSWWHQLGWDHSSGLVFVGWFSFCGNLQREIHWDVANHFENLYIVIWPGSQDFLCLSLVANIHHWYTMIYILLLCTDCDLAVPYSIAEGYPQWSELRIVLKPNINLFGVVSLTITTHVRARINVNRGRWGPPKS